MSELALILLVVAVILAIRKLPGLTRSAGKAARIFKSEAKALREQDAPEARHDTGRVVPGTVVERDEPPTRS
ncbi:twin-arginine translocase TatA/TatE family subunit [Streptomyces sp. NPDC017936]|uniref:twin-arginine translocase TatA/TatE family subunit n=1 Tax=Streptomyces sp. NPDC017936 TaxID=3365016 RepID=UPI0037B06A45